MKIRKTKLQLRKDITVLMSFGLGVLFILFPIFVINYFRSSVRSYLIAFSWIVGIIILIRAFIWSRSSKEDYIDDERNIRNRYKAGYISFWIMIILILITFIMYSPIPIIEDFTYQYLELEDLLRYIWFIGIISYSMLQRHYDKKG